MKGQTQALTAVLITTVTVGAIATGYIWGKPLIKKQQSEADVKQIEQDVLELRDEIESVAQSGSGTVSKVDLELEGGSIDVNPAQDYIDVQTSASQTPYPTGDWTLIRGEQEYNLSYESGSYAFKGKDLPGVAAVRVDDAEQSVVTYRVEFRNMYADTPSGTRLERIDLKSIGSEISSGDTTIHISNEGESEDTIKVESGEVMDRKSTEVAIDTR